MKPSRQSAVRRAKYGGSHTFTVYHNLPDIQALIEEIGQDIQAAVRPAAQAGAEVLYQAVRTNVSALGTYTGNLHNSIYQKYSEENSSPGRATYHVSWRTAKDGLPRAPHGHLVEFGYIRKYKVYLGSDGQWYTNKKAPLPEPVQVAAKPFIRPASAKYPEAVAAAKAKLLEVMSGSGQ